MKSLSFSFRPGVPTEARERTLEQVRSWEGVTAAGPLKRDSRDPDIARMAYARMDDDVDVRAMLDRLAALIEVERPDVHAERRLVIG
ncbi:MAG: hypothetical protein ABIT71_24390 [Vicinamibacteraceae bacterium]